MENVEKNNQQQPVFDYVLKRVEGTVPNNTKVEQIHLKRIKKDEFIPYSEVLNKFGS